MIGPGVELRLEKAQPRKIAYTACDNSRCTATVSNVPTKGFDKAYAALASK